MDRVGDDCWNSPGRVPVSQGGFVYSPLRVHAQEGANNQREFRFDDEQVTGHGWCRWRLSGFPRSVSDHPEKSPPHSTLFPVVDPPQVLTPNIVQTDDDSHHHFPSRPERPLSQLLIGSDACEGGGREEQPVSLGKPG